MIPQTRERLRRVERRAKLASSKRAGAHARRLVQERRRETLRQNWRAFATLVLIGTASALVAQFVLPGWVAPYVVGAIVVGTLWMCTSLLFAIDGTANYRLGIAGEEFTTDQLRKLRRRGWLFVNHVMLEKGDIDHVLLGPAGFFSVDSKYRTDWSGATGRLDEIAAAARRQADQLQKRLQMKTPIVQPAVVVWGPRSIDVFEEPIEHAGVIFCHGHSFVSHLRAMDETVSAATVEEAFTALDHYVARRDIGEARDFGDPARPIGDHVTDLWVSAWMTSATFIALSFITKVPPVGVWTVALAGAIAAASRVIRLRHRNSERIQRVTAATIATSLGFGTLILVVLVTYLIW